MQEQRKSMDVRLTPRPCGILISPMLIGNLPEKASSHPGEFTKNWPAGFTVCCTCSELTFFFISTFSFFLFIHNWKPGRCQNRLTPSWDGHVVIFPQLGTADFLSRFLVAQTTNFFIAFKHILYCPPKQGASPGSIQTDRPFIGRMITPRQRVRVFGSIVAVSPRGAVLVLLSFQSFHEAGHRLHRGNCFLTALSDTRFANWEGFPQRS